MQPASTPITIIIADDHPLILTGFRMMFKNSPRFKLVAEATTGEELLHAARKLKPDIIITDI